VLPSCRIVSSEVSVVQYAIPVTVTVSADTKLLKENKVVKESINNFNVLIDYPNCLLKLIIKYILKNETIHLKKSQYFY